MTGLQRRLNILFLCTGNSCRSQMAEGWTQRLKSKQFVPYSAGTQTHGLNPYAVQVMAEAGVDISGQRSKLVDSLLGIDFDYVITLCDDARESCPVFPGRARIIHAGFDDPPRLAKNAASEAERLDCYRRVRDEIYRFIAAMPGSLHDADRPTGHEDIGTTVPFASPGSPMPMRGSVRWYPLPTP